MTYDEYERKIQHLAKLYKECQDPQSKKILFIRGRLLRMGQERLKTTQSSTKPVTDMTKPLEPNEVYDVAKMIFG